MTAKYLDILKQVDEPTQSKEAMKTITLYVPLLLGNNHHDAGTLVEVEDARAKRLIELGHASEYVPQPKPEAEADPDLDLDPKPTRKPRVVETATRRCAPEKATVIYDKAD